MPTRRTPGEGTVYQRKSDGRWVARLPGARPRYAHTQKDARAKLREMHAEMHAHGSLPDGSITTAAWLDYWLDDIARPHLRDSTHRRYRGIVDTWCKPHIGAVRLEQLRPDHLTTLYAAMRAAGRAPASQLQVHRVLHRALAVAVQYGRLNRSPAARVQAPTVNRPEIEPFTPAQARAILAAASGDRMATRWSVALSLGLRQGEALGLRWADVELDHIEDGKPAPRLTVRQALQRKAGGGLTFTAPKGRARSRTIALPARLAVELRRHRTAQVAERLAAANRWHDHDLVWCQPHGAPIDPTADHKAWKALLERAGVPPKRLHDARHTAATLMLAQGVPARVAMQILGHSQVSLTLNTYSHVVPEIAQDAADRIDAALWGEA